MKFLNKLERTFGKYAIPHLMRYVLGLYIVGYIIDYMSAAMNVNIYSKYLMLDIDMLLKGQVWRLVTFLIQPPSVSNVIFLIFFLYLYYMIGEALEAAWGRFIFNLYFFSGVIFNILFVVGFYIATKSIYGVGLSFPIPLDYINQSLFLAFAVLYPNVQLLLFFFIPVKIKWIGIFEGVLLGYDFVSSIVNGIRDKEPFKIAIGISIVVALANFLIFWMILRKYRAIPRGMQRTRAQFRRNMARAQQETGRGPGFTTIAKHKCAICGRTELDDDTLEFRYCSKCVGNYEYCTDHLYTHTHVGNLVNNNTYGNGEQ